jgi:hypothetical protein
MYKLSTWTAQVSNLRYANMNSRLTFYQLQTSASALFANVQVGIGSLGLLIVASNIDLTVDVVQVNSQSV